MNVVDSSGWLEYFANGHNASFFAPAIEDTEHLIVPVITLYEVFKRTYQQRGENDALQVIVHMQQGTVIDVDVSLALEAARISADEKLPMADSLILATAQRYQSILWTQDIDLQKFPNVQYVQK
ncbi:MAG: type II toxin-antitoxin system VapC family toxin [Caldilineaceae bacterium]|nr:type II toxin-antitoxin system VapC family toxin [Caldilineaceae bacterium]